MDKVRGIRAHRLEVEVLQNVEDLCNVNAAGTGWRKPDDLTAAIGRDDRVAKFRVINSKILHRQQTAIPPHPTGGRLREGAAVEPVNAVRRDRPISFSKIRQPQNL